MVAPTHIVAAPGQTRFLTDDDPATTRPDLTATDQPSSLYTERREASYAASRSARRARGLHRPRTLTGTSSGPDRRTLPSTAPAQAHDHPRPLLTS